MYIPLSRGNQINLLLKNYKELNIFDHSYNSSYESLLFISENARNHSILVFSPILECIDLEDKYREFIALIQEIKKTREIKFIAYYPKDIIEDVFFEKIITNEVIDGVINNLQDAKQTMLPMVDLILKNSEQCSVYIKGANRFNLVNLVINLIENYCKN